MSLPFNHLSQYVPLILSTLDFHTVFLDSSDSQSDGTNSGCEEKSTSGAPSKSSSNNTIKITNNGHAMKIIVEGGNYGSGKSLDADVVLNGSNNPNPTVSGQTTTLQVPM